MWHKTWQNKLTLLIIIGIAVRLIAAFLPGQFYDMQTYEAWGNIMLASGPRDFFVSTWSDYLPLPIYFLAVVSFLSNSLSVSFTFVLKLLLGIIESLLVLGLYRNLSSSRRFIVLPLLFLSPALLGDSVFWGQLDVIPSLLTLLALTQFMQKKKNLLLPITLFTLALAVKPIMAVTMPVFIVLYFQNHRFSLRTIFYILYSLLLFIIPSVPIRTSFLEAIQFLVSKATEQASTYPFTTINAWNFWNINNLALTWPTDSAVVLGLSLHSWGLIFFLLLAGIVIHAWAKHGYHLSYSYRVAATLLLIFFSFTTRMHERHLLFGIPFLALAAQHQSWLIFPYLLYSLLYILNLWGAFYWVNHTQVWPFPVWLMSLASVMTTSLSLLLATVWDWPKFWRACLRWPRANPKLLAVLVFAASLRLINLSYPDRYIFDEVYHAFTAREYLEGHQVAWEWWTTPPEGVAYEWTHPPVAKYGMVVGMAIFGENSLGWRFGGAVFGVISILGLYKLVHVLFKNDRVALLSAFLLSIEGLHLAQSRLAMNDIYMLTFYIWSLYASVKSRWKLAAVLYGLALGSKWSALYGILPIGLIFLRAHLTNLSVSKVIRHLLYAVRLLLIVVFTYLLSFAPFILSGHSVEQLLELHRQMWYYHTHLVATHAYESTPWQWIFALRPVWYFVEYAQKVANIYAQGNPLILWLGLIAFVLQLKKIITYPYLLFYILYSIFVLPWLLSPRIMFFYHYLPSATFLTVILASWLANFSKKSIFYILVLCSLVFVIMSPVYYGIPMPPSYWDTLFALFPSWR